MKRTAIFVAFWLGGTALVMLIAGCAGYLPPTINIRADGIIEHIDTADKPEGCGVACWRLMTDGSRHIWRASNAPKSIIDHEVAHDKGMRHGPWVGVWQNNWIVRYCTTVTMAGGGYFIGQTLCQDQSGETVL